MPVMSYPLNDYLKSLLVDKINYLNEQEFAEHSLLLREITENSIGKNPRALKRVINYLSLINCIISEDPEQSTDKSYETKIIQYILISLQLAYPSVYSFLVKYPNFTEEWTERSYSHEMKKLTIDKIAIEDEDWKNTLLLHIHSHKSPFLIERSRRILNIFNGLTEFIEQCRNEEDFDSFMYNMIQMSSITDAQSDSSSQIENHKETWTSLNTSLQSRSKILGEFNVNKGSSSSFKFADHNKVFKVILSCNAKDHYSLELTYQGKKKGSAQWNQFEKWIVSIKHSLGDDNVKLNDKKLSISALRETEFFELIEQLGPVINS